MFFRAAARRLAGHGPIAVVCHNQNKFARKKVPLARNDRISTAGRWPGGRHDPVL